MIEKELQKRTLPIAEGHWGSADTGTGKEVNGAPLLLFQEGTIWRTCPKRIYSEKEGLTSWEGYMSLDKRGDPRLQRRPRHKRKQKRDISLMLWAQPLSDDGVLCLGHSASRVPWLQLMLDPWVRSVTIYHYTYPCCQSEHGHQPLGTESSPIV